MRRLAYAELLSLLSMVGLGVSFAVHAPLDHVVMFGLAALWFKLTAIGIVQESRR